MEELIPFAGDLLTAVIGGAWWAAALAVLAILRVAIRVVPWEPLRSIPVQVVGGFALAFGGALANVVAAGAGITGEVLQTALAVGSAAGAAAGGWTALMAWWKDRQGPGASSAALLLLLGTSALLPARADAAISVCGKGVELTVGTTAVALRDPTMSLTYARSVLVCVPDTEAGTLFVNGQGVTASTGIPVAPGRCYSSGERLADGVALYGIAASGTVKVRVQECY